MKDSIGRYVDSNSRGIRQVLGYVVDRDYNEKQKD